MFLYFYFIILYFYFIIRTFGFLIQKSRTTHFPTFLYWVEIIEIKHPADYVLDEGIEHELDKNVLLFFYYDSTVKELFKKMSTTEASEYVRDCTCALVNVVSPVITFLLKYNRQHFIMKRTSCFVILFLKNLFNLFSHRK